MSTARFDVVGIGEALVRLTPPGADVLETAAAYTVQVGGAEANVCANLAALGVRTAWMSRLPANPLGRRVASAFAGLGVNVDGIRWAPQGRVGLVFVQPGAPPRSGEVLYYRLDSAFSEIDADEIAWSVLDGASLLHLTGITPALGTGPRRLVERAIVEAQRRRVRVSLDVNYRATLWTPAAAREVLEPLLRERDVVFLNERDARAVFGVEGDPESTAGTLRQRFHCGTLVLTLGAAGALARDGTGVRRHAAYPGEVVDRIGRGDAFASGFLYGYLRGDVDAGLSYGAAMAALKQTYPGDVCRATLAEIEAVLGGQPGGFRR
ncbi:MAG TPA: sugar kinase [bacterium]|nr:sugar kinase [bacterium]